MARTLAGLLLLLVATGPVLAQPSAEDLVALLPARTGLVAFVGSGDAVAAAGLAATGRVLVHVLADDRADRDGFRDAFRRHGACGAAAAETLADTHRLPYPDGMVNVLVVDRSSRAGREVATAEVLRVVAPGGKAVLGRGDAWKTILKPVDPAMGVWTHPNGNAANNAVSGDRMVGPVSTVRWLFGFARGGQTMGGSGGIPVIGAGVIVQDDPRGFIGRKGHRAQRSERLVCRDAHSGLVRWATCVKGTRLWLAIDGERLVSAYALPDRAGVAHVHDLQTGDVLRSLVTDADRAPSTSVHGVCRDSVAYLTFAEGSDRAMASGRLVAWDLATGNVRWRRAAEGFDTYFSPSLTPDGRRLIVVEAAGRRTGLRARWPWAYVHAVLCLDPGTGKTLWRNRDVAGSVTLHVPVTDRYAFLASPWGIGSHYEHIARDQRDTLPRGHGVLDVTDGRVLWRKDTSSDAHATERQWSQVAFFRGHEVFLCQPSYFLAWDAATGALTRRITTRVFNQRCVRTRASGAYLIAGFGTFYDLACDRQTDQNVSRSACAVGATPAYGTVYNGANACRCFAQVRGYGAFAPAGASEVLPDAARLQVGPFPAGPGGAVSAAVEVARVTTEDRALRRDATWRCVVVTDKPLRDSWINNEDAPYPLTEPLPAGDLTLLAVVAEHRLEARRGDRVVWSLTTGARISRPPLVRDGRAYLASHDGWVYCCSLASGRLLWRALVAPNVRWMVAYGQLESAWPVRNVVWHEGLVCAAAGRHPELDGGIHLAGLEPATGRAVWRKTVAFDSAHTWFRPDDRTRDRHLNWVTNGGLVVEEGRLLLRGLDVVEGGGNKVPRLNPLPIRSAEAPARAPG